MANTKSRPRYTKMLTPVGVAQYPHLNKPDTKFNPDGEYRLSLILDPSNPNDATFLENLEAEYDKGYEQVLAEENTKREAKGQAPKKSLKRADLPVKPELDDDDEETGRVIISFKVKAKYQTRKGDTVTNKVGLFDTNNKPLPKNVFVWGGSTVVVSFQVIPYYTSMVGAGISLRLKAVQVHELVTSDSGSAESHGFAATGGGYVYDGSDDADADDSDTTYDNDVEDNDAGDDEEDF